VEAAVKKAVLIALAMGIATAAAPSAGEAKPGGCLKYGAAGAVAGHAAGGHAVKGALAGCAAGMWTRHRYNKQQREQREMQKREQRELNRKTTD
jgi:hypothetical protein